MKNKKGFIAISVIFSFFIVFLMLITLNLTSYAQNRILMNQIKKDIKNTFVFISCPNNVSASTKLCKRALNLHTEICNNEGKTGNLLGSGFTSSRYCGVTYSIGASINYGKCGTKGTLNIGDAFNCDVNGDGVYDDTTERFYYISDSYNTTTKTFDSNTAALIFFDNINSKGKIDSTNIAENKTTYANSNTVGPQNAVQNLPLRTLWKNIRLKNETRNIIDNKGNLIVSNFNYSNYAARLLTMQELSGCVKNLEKLQVGGSNDNRNTGELEECIFLIENTNYANKNKIDSYWLENVYNSGINTISGSYRMVNATPSTDVNVGVRPVIEVSKSDIDY